MSLIPGVPDTNLEKIAFSSLFRYERIAVGPDGKSLKGHVIIPQGNSPVTITHGLGYVPYVKATYEFMINGKLYMLPALYTVQSYIEILIQPTETTLTVNAFDNWNWDGSSATLFHNLPVYYRIYAEPIKV